MDDLIIQSLTRLDESPYDPGEDRVYWEAAISDSDGYHTIRLWATGTDAARAAAGEDWVRSALQRTAALYDDVDTLYALSPIQVRPEP